MNNENINMILMKEEMKSKTTAWLLAYFLGFLAGIVSTLAERNSHGLY